jgi:hypothetical protein
MEAKLISLIKHDLALFKELKIMPKYNLIKDLKILKKVYFFLDKI